MFWARNRGQRISLRLSLPDRGVKGSVEAEFQADGSAKNGIPGWKTGDVAEDVLQEESEAASYAVGLTCHPWARGRREDANCSRIHVRMSVKGALRGGNWFERADISSQTRRKTLVSAAPPWKLDAEPASEGSGSGHRPRSERRQRRRTPRRRSDESRLGGSNLSVARRRQQPSAQAFRVAELHAEIAHHPAKLAPEANRLVALRSEAST